MPSQQRQNWRFARHTLPIRQCRLSFNGIHVAATLFLNDEGARQVTLVK
jgi:hypothetical protein